MAEAGAPTGRVLEPIERVSEIVFGVLMAMTFIGTLNIATAGRDEVRTALIAALGCNVAWGLTDGVMYLVAILTERTRERTLVAARDGAARAPAARLGARDFRGALGVFLLVTASTFPLVVPFLVFHQLAAAMAASRVIAVALLFLGGCLLGHYSGGRPLVGGIGLAVVGAALLAAIMALGG